jgi:hypothetical protein
MQKRSMSSVLSFGNSWLETDLTIDLRASNWDLSFQTEFVVPLPINFSHTHRLMLMGWCSANGETFSPMSTNTHNFHINANDLCMKDYSSADTLRFKEWQIHPFVVNAQQHWDHAAWHGLKMT